jgi:hypothetical protein
MIKEIKLKQWDTSFKSHCNAKKPVFIFANIQGNEHFYILLVGASSIRHFLHCSSLRRGVNDVHPSFTDGHRFP